jgi:hypothetical protein
MEGVLLLGAIVGIALIVVPRVKRRGARSPRAFAEDDPPPELPSVERRRAAADETELLDHDGLGWEGQDEDEDDRAGHAATNGQAAPEGWARNGHATQNGHAAPEDRARNGVGGRDLARTTGATARRRGEASAARSPRRRPPRASRRASRAAASRRRLPRARLRRRRPRTCLLLAHPAGVKPPARRRSVCEFCIG